MVDGSLSGGRGMDRRLPEGGVPHTHGIRGRPSATVIEKRGISLTKRERAQPPPQPFA